MTTLRLTDPDVTAARVDVLVVGVTREASGGLSLQPGAEGLAKAFAKAFRGGLPAALAAVGATGKAEEVTRLASLGAAKAPTLLAVGLGEQQGDAGLSGEVVRRAAGAAARTLAGTGSAATTLASAEPALIRPVAEGFALGGYRFDRYRTVAGEDRHLPPLGSVALAVGKGKAARLELERAGALTDAIGICRDLVNTPAADLHPADFATRAATLAGEYGVEAEVLDERALASGGYGGILGVGQGSAHPPRLVRLAYRAKRSAPTVALVGKGITFDSGGLSLKPGPSMVAMKSDMGGAAAVLCSVLAAARLQLPVNVTGWLPSAENMPSGTAIRPSDVLRMYGGRTVEVLNTDAEGRLVLADAIVRAAEERPDALIDLATLTGAQLVALGSRTFAVMANDEELRADLIKAAGAAGEPAWPMPLPEELRKSLDSEIADIANIGDRNGGMLVAGLFLREFVPAGLPWAHLDIAGPAFNTAEAYGYTPKGGTGAGIRTVIEYLRARAT